MEQSTKKKDEICSPNEFREANFSSGCMYGTRNGWVFEFRTRVFFPGLGIEVFVGNVVRIFQPERQREF